MGNILTQQTQTNATMTLTIPELLGVLCLMAMLPTGMVMTYTLDALTAPTPKEQPKPTEEQPE